MDSPREIIELWTARVLADPDLAGKLGAVYKFNIEGPQGGIWVFDCSGRVEVKEEDLDADCTLFVSAEDFIAINKAELNPQAAYLNGKLRLSGDFSLALRLIDLFDTVA